MRRRQALQVIGSGSLATAAWPLAAQQGSPGIVRIVVPYAAGGQTDIIARMLAQSMQKTLGRNVVVENRPGAAALIATRAVQAAPPDGDTLLFHNSGMVALPMLQKSAVYDVQKDFEPVSMTGVGPNFLMVTEAVPARTVPELLDYARSQPGGLECANSGINSGGHIAAMLLEKLAKIQLTHIPYKGSAEVATALISGQVKMQVSVTTDALNPHIQSGKIRMLAVATRERTALAPNLPTIGSFVPGYALDGWFGILAPAKTPLAKREELSSAIKIALDEPSTRERMTALYMETKHRSPTEFAEIIAGSITNFRNVVNTLGLTAQ